MENPATWTDLHWELSKYCYYDSDPDYIDTMVLNIKQCLDNRNYLIPLEDIKKVCLKYKKEVDDHICGLSLMSQIVNEFCKGER